MALFENFPYTDMHNLNLDWIIKIAKDFLDQYTHIQELISQGIIDIENKTTSGLDSLDEKATELNNLLDTWYGTHSEDIANQLANALNDLNSWYNTHENYLNETLATNITAFNAAAAERAAQTIETIPDDYTDLYDNVLYVNDSIKINKYDSNTITYTDNKGVSSQNNNIVDTTETALTNFFKLNQGETITIFNAAGLNPVRCIAAFINNTDTTAFDGVNYTVPSNAETHSYTAPQDCYVAFTVLKTVKADVVIYSPSANKNNIQKNLDALNHAAYIPEIMKPSVVTGSYINTGYSVGTVVSLDPVSNVSEQHCIIDVVEGDIFIINAAGGAAARAYCIIDNDNKIVDVAPASFTAVNKILYCETYGKLIINSFTTTPIIVEKINKSINITKIIENLNVSTLALGGTVKCNYDVGTVISLVATHTQGGWKYAVYDCNPGDKFILSCVGGEGGRAYCLVDANNKILARAGSYETVSNKTIIAPVNGKFIVNYSTGHPFSLVIIRATKYDKLPAINLTAPYVIYNYDYEFHNIDQNIITAFNSSVANRVTDIQNFFDSLVSQYDFVTSYDAANFASLSYPGYASGYTTKLYKFSYQNSNFYKPLNPKKTMFIIAGVHGNEKLSPYNLYMVLKEMCQISDPNLFKLLSAFDIYVIPCVNGWGLNNDSRTNYNRVDINRNFNVEGWSEAWQNEYIYTGPSANSEFETQLITKCYGIINPDIAIDCHNYYGTTQFYSEFTDLDTLRMGFQSSVDCSYAFIKNMPQYFGTQMCIFNDSETSAPSYVQEFGIGKTTKYFYEKGCKFAATIEVNEGINYVDGVYTDNAPDHGGEATFKVAEYTLRNQLLKYSEYVLSLL